MEHLEMPKMMDIGNLRTDATEIQEVVNYDLLPKIQSNYKGFPSTGLLGDSTTTINECIMNPHPQPDIYGQFMTPMQESREQKWRECHEYYLQWIYKLKSLLEFEAY